MAKRILPYRDYSEHDVINAFSLDTADYTISDAKPAASGAFDAGVVVAVTAGTLPGDVHEQATDGNLRDYLGASYSASSTHIGYSSYPYNGMTVGPADSTDTPVGITLRETLAYDENGEKMLYYPVKLDEHQGVLPGHTVPVLTRGTVLLTSHAFDGSESLAAGDKLQLANGGKLAEYTDGTVVGTVLAVGKESTEGEGVKTKFLCKLSF